MSPNALEERLAQIRESNDLLEYAEEIIEELKTTAEPNIEYVQAILRFMEANEDLDFNGPSPFIRYIESYGVSAYKTELLASISRYPTTDTTCMLNAIINVTKEADERRKLIAIMREIAASDSMADSIASRFMMRLE